MGGKIIFVVTNHDQLGTTGKQTGWYLPEVAHPYKILADAGFEVVFISPKGGKAPMDPGSKEMFKDDEICKDFEKNDKAMKMLNETKQAKDVKPGECKGLFYAGGHGPMFDLPNAKDIAELTAKIFEQGGVVGAVCHGTVGLLHVKLSNGKNLVEGKKVTSFTNAEEDAVQLSKQMPFMLETELENRKAIFVKEDNWACNVVVDGKLVTGQNPASATKVGEEMKKLLQ